MTFEQGISDNNVWEMRFSLIIFHRKSNIIYNINQVHPKHLWFPVLHVRKVHAAKRRTILQGTYKGGVSCSPLDRVV